MLLSLLFSRPELIVPEDADARGSERYKNTAIALDGINSAILVLNKSSDVSHNYYQNAGKLLQIHHHTYPEPWAPWVQGLWMHVRIGADFIPSYGPEL